MSAPSVSRIGPVAHRQEVGDFSIGIMGIFASALTGLKTSFKTALTGVFVPVYCGLKRVIPAKYLP
jgi:hypothetical protein